MSSWFEQKFKLFDKNFFVKFLFNLDWESQNIFLILEIKKCKNGKKLCEKNCARFARSYQNKYYFDYQIHIKGIILKIHLSNMLAANSLMPH